MTRRERAPQIHCLEMTANTKLDRLRVLHAVSGFLDPLAKPTLSKINLRCLAECGGTTCSDMTKRHPRCNYTKYSIAPLEVCDYTTCWQTTVSQYGPNASNFASMRKTKFGRFRCHEILQTFVFSPNGGYNRHRYESTISLFKIR